jgi:hypothetical protein
MDNSTTAPVADINGDASQEWVDRYLAVLGLERREPSLDALEDSKAAEQRFERRIEQIEAPGNRVPHGLLAGASTALIFAGLSKVSGSRR